MEPTFPAPCASACASIREELGQLANNRETLRVVERARRKLRGFEAVSHDPATLHAYIDELQLIINSLHGAIKDTWFLSGPYATFRL
jgi:uncharacterized alpha-E superfamily protein